MAKVVIIARGHALLAILVGMIETLETNFAKLQLLAYEALVNVEFYV